MAIYSRCTLFGRDIRSLVRSVALGLAVLVAVAASLGFAGTASANPPVVETKVFITALSETGWCEQTPEGETCYQATVEAGTGKEGELFVCLGITGEGPKGNTFEEGCADVSTTFDINRNDLSSASLAKTSIDLIAYICDPDTKECQEVPSRTVSLAVAWTGIDKLEKDTTKDNLVNPICTTHYNNKHLFRQAATTVTIDDVAREGNLGSLQLTEQTTRTFCEKQ